MVIKLLLVLVSIHTLRYYSWSGWWWYVSNFMNFLCYRGLKIFGNSLQVSLFEMKVGCYSYSFYYYYYYYYYFLYVIYYGKSRVLVKSGRINNLSRLIKSMNRFDRGSSLSSTVNPSLSLVIVIHMSFSLN